MLNSRESSRTGGRAGFTLIEVTISLVILSVALLGIASSTARMIEPAMSAEAEFLALQAVESRLSLIKMEPRYGKLDSLFAGAETSVPGLVGYTRNTRVTRTSQTVTGGGKLDFTTLIVTVTGPKLKAPVFRKLVVASP